MCADRRVDDEQVSLAVEVLRILADATRLRILLALTEGAGEPTKGAGDRTEGAAEMSVGELADAVGARPSGVSQHLAKLRMARLVTTRRLGTQVLYQVANEHVSQLVGDALRHSEHLGPGTPAHHQR